MKNKNLIRLLGFLVFLPLIMMSVLIGGLLDSGTYVSASSPVVLLQKDNMEKISEFLTLPNLSELAFGGAVDEEAMLAAQVLEAKAEAVDAYFREYNMPLEGTGMKMVEEAEKNDLDWRLLPAIAVIESTGGKFACKNARHSFFGWGSCKIDFKSKDHAIEVVAWNLGGNNPKTIQHYADKTTKEILRSYNPPYIVPNYTSKVLRVMDDIGEKDLTPATLLTANI